MHPTFIGDNNSMLQLIDDNKPIHKSTDKVNI